MTREELAHKIRWPVIIWLVGIINPLWMLPQVWLIWTTHQTDGVSLTSLGIVFFIQLGFSLHGFFIRDNPLMMSNGAAAVITAVTYGSVLYWR